MRRFGVTGGVLLVTAIACGKGGSSPGPDAGGTVTADRSDEVGSAMSGLGGTKLEASVPLSTLVFDASGQTFDVGGGVQVLQATPTGTGRRAVQAAVVFDRPVVPLGDLDTMNAGAPLTCTPDVGAKARWAGTSTAVLNPKDGAFPDATAFTCRVEAGLKAVDGAVLEKALEFTFETRRPSVLAQVPNDGAAQVRPEDPITLTFDQEVEPSAVGALLSLEDGDGRDVPVSVVAGETAQRVTVTAKLAKDSHYTLRLKEGLVGKEGPLPSLEPWVAAFDTYPPLAVVAANPQSSTSANAWFELEFSTPVSRKQVSDHLTVEPRPPRWEPGDDDWPSRWWGYGVALEPRTRYTLTLSADTVDDFGQRLGEPYTWTVDSLDYDPSANFPTGLQLVPHANPPDLPFKHLNLSAVDLSAGRFSPDALVVVNDWETLAAPVAIGGRTVSIEMDPTPNRTELEKWSYEDLLSPDGYGWVATRLSSPDLVDWEGKRRPYDGLWVVTDLGGTVKMGPTATEVWVTSLASGAPVEGVDVRVHRGAKIVGTARTDATGLATVATALVGSGWDRKDTWVELAKGNDDSLVVTRWGPDGWRYVDDSDHQVRSDGFLDRGVYRLGDPVYGQVTFRRADATGLVVPKGEASWRLADPDGEVVAEGTAPLDARGNVSVKTELPKVGRLGDWSLKVSGSGEDWSRDEWLPVSARAYRPPAFRVNVSARDAGVVGEPVEATLDARYLFGAEMAKGGVTWRAWTEERWFAPEGWDGWSFGEEPSGWWEESETVSPELPGAEGALAERRTFAATVPADAVEGPVALFLEAEVQDVDRQVIANRSETLVHPGSVYAAVRPVDSLPTAGQPTTVEVAGVDLEGKATAGVPVKLALVRRQFDSVRERGMDGHWKWVNTTTDTEVATSEVTTAGEPVSWSVTPTDTGRHVIVATAKDPSGREVVTESSVWVLGSGYASWGRRDDGQIGLVLEKDEVAPGETARVLVQSPLPDLWAWITVEREGVLWREIRQLKGTTPTIEIPTSEAWMPSVRVSVVAVTGAGPQDAPDKGRPEAFVGTAELAIDSSREHLAVEVSPAREVYRPRDRVDVTVAVKREGAAAAGAGVTLYAVDEAILSLTDYQTPDLYSSMYAAHGHQVATADGRFELLDRAPFLTKGAKIGGGGGEGTSGTEVRNKFVTTVTWQTDLVTGPDGTVKASFELPDNLTAFRVIAVADQGATAFGSADREIRVTRPLVVRAALPRLLREGDQSYTGVVVHNDTDEQRWVEVGAAVEGPVELTGAPFGLDVPARTSVEVPFRLKALEAGHVKFTFRADSGDDHDAVEAHLEVGRDVVIETTATSGLADGTWTEQLARPDGARPGFGGLRLDVASTALVGTTDGLDYLLDYPYGCVEQKTARGLGALALLSVYDRSGTTLSKDVLEHNVRDVVESLPRYRAGYPGGYAYWPGGDQPSVLGTVYAVEFLARAKAQGFVVADSGVKAGVDFLREATTNGDWWFRGWSAEERLAVEAHVVYALALAGQPDAGLASRVWDGRNRLPVFALARLQEALASVSKDDPRVAAISGLVASRTTIEAAGASVKETGSGRWARLWASDDLATAAALEGLVAAGGGPLAPKYALHLASSRKTGHWNDTRSTATALFALARYADAYETHGDAVKVAVSLAGAELLSEKLKVPGSARAEIPMAKLQNGPLVVTTDDPVYWFARLQYAPQLPVARDEGITVQRHLEILDGGGAGDAVVSGATVRVTLTVVTPVARHFVAVVDPLPAGFEPVDTSLATASRAGREQGFRGYEDELEDETSELPDFGGSVAFDHDEIDDGEVRLFATYLPPGVHTYRYVARATSPGVYSHPSFRAEEMYEPENFGRTRGGTITIGEAPAEVAHAP